MPVPKNRLHPIRRFRERSGLTVADMARACGVSWKAAKMWDEGLRAPGLPNVALILSVLAKHGVTVEAADLLPKAAR